eukprot:m.18432 g.18432  ORF g.18432 m.18432 type:complete len:780 (+) comp27660_c0_seq1:15-2354(+)
MQVVCLSLCCFAFLTRTSGGSVDHIGVWDSPPGGVPSGKVVGGPILGNGDLGVALGGSESSLQFYVSLNQFWAIEKYTYPKREPNYPRVVSLGGVRVDIPDFAGFNYHAEQNIDEAQVTTNFTHSKSGAALLSRSYVAVNENTLITSLTVSGTNSSIDFNVTTWTTPGGDVARRTAAGCTAPNGSMANCTDGTQPWGSWILREAFPDYGPYSVVGAVGTRLLSCVAKGSASDGRSFSTSMVSLGPNQTMSIFTTVLTNRDVGYTDPVAAVQERLRNVTPPVLDDLKMQHAAWWTQFWSLSSVSFPDETLLENYWYGAQYILACSSRKGKVAPGLWGPWVTTDSAGWHGDYTLNYNFQAPFYGVYSSNHIDLAWSQYQPLLDFLPMARQGAKAFNCSGLHYPTHIAPWGFPGSIGPSPYGDLKQHSTGSFSALNFISHWEYTMNRTFLASLAYPFIKEVAEFWECWLQKENKTDGGGGYRWVDPHDCTNENCGGDPSDFNPIVSLSFIRRIFLALIDMSNALGVESKPIWMDFVENLSNYTVVSVNVPGIGKGPVWLFSEPTSSSSQVAPPKPNANPINLYPLWPAETVNMIESSKDDLAVGRNSVLFMASWTEGNAFMEMFPAAVRAGLDISMLMNTWRETLRKTMLSSFYVSEGGGGVETAGATQAINDMLLQSVGRVLVLFPVWPDNENASFIQLRAKGAFLVNGSYNGQEKTTGNVTVFSEAGQDCTMANPWPQSDVVVSEMLPDGSEMRVDTLWSKQRFTFKTAANGRYKVSLKT